MILTRNVYTLHIAWKMKNFPKENQCYLAEDRIYILHSTNQKNVLTVYRSMHSYSSALINCLGWAQICNSPALKYWGYRYVLPCSQLYLFQSSSLLLPTNPSTNYWQTTYSISLWHFLQWLSYLLSVNPLNIDFMKISPMCI